MKELTKNDQLSALLHLAAWLPESFFAQLEMQGIYLGNGYFFETLFYINPNDFCAKQLFFELEHELLRLFSGEYLLHCGLVDGNFVSLFCFPRLLTDEKAYEARSAVIQKLSQQLDFQSEAIAAIISPVCHGTHNISSMHQLCEERQAYFRFVGAEPKVFSFEINVNHLPAVAQFDDMKQNSKLAHHFAMSVKNGVLDKKLLQQFYDFILPKDVNALPLTRYRIQTFLNYFLLTLDEYREVDRSFLMQHAGYHHLLCAETFEIFQQQFSAFIEDILQSCRKFKCGSGLLKSKQAVVYKAYIDSNLQLPTLDIAEAARELNVSQSLLSAIFKREFGTAPSEYIRKQRVNMAKALLEQTDKTLYEIMMDVGFASLSTFQRAFRSNEGITPGRYRMTHRKQKTQK